LIGHYDDLRPIIRCRIAAPGGILADNTGGLEVTALVDTGANITMIPSRLVSRLSLPCIGSGFNFTAAGEVPVDKFGIELGFDLMRPDGGRLNYKIDNGAAVVLPDTPFHDITIGMETLNCFEMKFEKGFGPFHLTYIG
jgi:hypothetical protein